MVDTPTNVDLGPNGDAAIAKGQAGLTPSDGSVPAAAPSGPQRPEWVPEKFWDANTGQVNTEALAKSYAELEKARSAAAAPAPAQSEPPAAAPSADGKVKVEAPAADGASAAPLTEAIEAVRVTWSEKGEVSDDDFAKLEAAGIPRDVANLYFEGLKAVQAQTLAQIHGFVDGGKEAYDAMIAWAAKSLSPAEAEAFNNDLDDPARRETAVRGLYARYSTSVPNEGRMISPNGGAAAAGDVFQSRDDLVAAQKDPRYQTDAVYRQGVIDKLARSQKTGFAAFERTMFGREVVTR